MKRIKVSTALAAAGYAVFAAGAAELIIGVDTDLSFLGVFLLFLSIAARIIEIRGELERARG